MELRRWNVRHVRQVLETAPHFVPFARGGDTGLEAIRAQIGPASIADLLDQARADALAPIPALPASLYLEFARTGRREGYEDAQRARRNMLYRLTLAEWLEGQGTFVDAIENLAFARLEETNWAWPAHARMLDMPDHPTVDLAAAMTALDLAEMDYLIGDALSPSLRARLRSEIDRRTVAPFLERNDHWWLHSTPDRQVNNWTAVCVAGVVGAACYLETDRDRLANIITRGLHSLADYLETFDSQGGSSEGPDYWSYGFGNYVVLAQLLHARTGGQVDLLDDPQIREIAQFPVRTVLTQGLWASFSDSDSNPTFHPGLLTHLAERLELPALTELGMQNDFRVEVFNQFAWPLRQFAWPLPERNVAFGGAPHDWFADMAWMISRLDPGDPNSLRLAIKGGHNDEMHNQNDVGSLIVVSKGRVVLTDPGRGRYSKAYFGPERYSNIMASSRGHSVPVVNGQEQAEGRQHAAAVLGHSHGEGADRLTLEMAAAYPAAAGIAALERDVVFDRSVPGGRVTLSDSFSFTDREGAFQSVLVTPLAVEAGPETVRIGDAAGGVSVRFDPRAVSVSTERHDGVEKQYAPSVDLTRVLFTALPRAARGQVNLEISPL
ncbi:MAG: heparinase II/III-family protein [Alphaproteobacteria bacterium]|nr:heparinase II/III-family protein [Alphaproteobacteria bacterium]MBU1560685.1 heparinase II/III-family protein [Alphaproteobacteria bacterium]MBU2301931.1 heparinase II/III-family protein [Alphaproteobacteria bacterium]MBU2368981.1 heparinase II/III-family protein [Alphaproteobacteria bacterium]